MITGAHTIIYSSNPDADKAFFRDVLKFTNIDVGNGWLIFKLPPAELAVHPSEKDNFHELYLLCDDIQEFYNDMTKQNIKCSLIQNRGWGSITYIPLPGGSSIGVYEPHHARP